MGARAGVLRLERARERRNRLEVRRLERLALAPLELEKVPKVARVEQQRVLARLPRAGHPERHSVKPARQPLDERKQFQGPERLPHHGVGAGRRELSLLAAAARQEDDRDLRRLLVALQPLGELDPAHPGHPHIEDDHVRALKTDAP